MIKQIQFQIMTDHQHFEQQKELMFQGSASRLIRVLSVEQISSLFKVESRDVTIPTTDPGVTRDAIVYSITYNDGLRPKDAWIKKMKACNTLEELEDVLRQELQRRVNRKLKADYLWQLRKISYKGKVPSCKL